MAGSRLATGFIYQFAGLGEIPLEPAIDSEPREGASEQCCAWMTRQLVIRPQKEQLP